MKGMDDKHIALLIGNEYYENFEILKTPTRDAKCVGKVLGNLGFDIDCKENQSASEIYDLVQKAVEKLRIGATSMVFYYAGHGCRMGSNEYLMPVEGMSVGDSEVVAQSFVKMKKVIKLLIENRASDKVPIIFILDCCHLELEPGGSRSGAGARRSEEINDLTNLETAVNTCIMYSTARGYTASGGGKES